jgi:hypothetical protein
MSMQLIRNDQNGNSASQLVRKQENGISSFSLLLLRKGSTQLIEKGEAAGQHSLHIKLILKYIARTINKYQ